MQYLHECARAHLDKSKVAAGIIDAAIAYEAAKSNTSDAPRAINASPAEPKFFALFDIDRVCSRTMPIMQTTSVGTDHISWLNRENKNYRLA